MTAIEHQRFPDGVCLLSARGEIDFAATERLLPDLRTVAAESSGIVLDLTEVSFFDSAGVRLVEHLARACRLSATGFRVVAPAGGVPRRVLDLVGMVSSSTVTDVPTGLAELREP